MTTKRMKKLYVMRLRDHAQSLKRRARALRARQTRGPLSQARAELLESLAKEILFMEMWIEEVKK